MDEMKLAIYVWMSCYLFGKYYKKFTVFYYFLGTVKAAPHECVIRTGQS